MRYGYQQRHSAIPRLAYFLLAAWVLLLVLALGQPLAQYIQQFIGWRVP